MNNSVNTSPLNFLAELFDLSNFSVKIGINTTDKAPSPKILLNRLGNLNATLTQSPKTLEPNVAAINNSLNSPKILETIVKKATVIPDLSSINSFFVECMYELILKKLQSLVHSIGTAID